MYRNSDDIKKLWAPIFADINRTEATLETLLGWANLHTASGIMLDRIGGLKWIDVERPPNMPDETYRAFIRAGILAHVSGGTHPDVLKVVEALHIRNKSATASVLGVKPFTVIAVVPGLLGLEIPLARKILVRAINVTDRLYLLTPGEGFNYFQYDNPNGPYDTSFWIPEA